MADLEARRPDIKARVDAILAADPGHRTDYFQAANWADRVRPSWPETGAWHYVDFLFDPEHPDATPALPAPPHAISQLAAMAEKIHDTSDPRELADALCFLLHLAGDIHQPFHCITRVTPEHEAPEGDRGGNLFKLAGHYHNLHSLWDDSVNLLLQDSAEALADEIRERYPRGSLAPELAVRSPEAWARAGYAIAVEQGYGALANGHTDAPRPSNRYLRAARDIGQRQAALGGYRLADLLIDILGGEVALSAPPDREGSDRLALYEALGVPRGSIPPSVSGTGAITPPTAPFDLPAIDRDGLDALERKLDERPEEVLQRARAAIGPNLTERELRRAIQDARIALDAPREALSLIEAQRALGRASQRLPDDFTFEGMDLARIPIEPGNSKFEELGDVMGWIIHTGRYLFGSPVGDRGNFRFHSDYPSRFVYPLRGSDGTAPLEIALFSDFGTGLYHSRYIAKQLVTRRFPYAIHLGDVYYAGRQEEFAENFEEELDPLLGTTRLFTMNGNHEMFSLGVYYFDYISRRKARSPSLQEQEGSYFCLRGPTAQIIGVDTDYFGEQRYSEPEMVGWLADQLRFGLDHQLTNVLLTGDQPYEYGKSGLTKLLDQDLRPFLGSIDLWFWGNTHYCALFDRSDELPFIGSCVGHGGFPYDRLKRSDVSPAPARFAELSGRFPEWTKLRQDRGNNGYCVLTLKPGGDIGLRYVDWMAHDRCLASLRRSPDGRLALSDVRSF